MSTPPPPPPPSAILTTWSRAHIRQPFDAAQHNRLIGHLNGEIAAPQTWTAEDGTTGLAWEPAVPQLTIGADLAADGDLAVAGDVEITGGVEITGNLAVVGDATFDGAMTLGDLPADAIHVKGTLLLDEPLVLPPGSTGTAPPDNSVTSAKIVNGTIVNADISPTADIDASKLLDGTVTTLKIADGTLLNVDVNAAAAIALSKLAPGSAGVLKSNGTTITAGNQIVSGDITDDTLVNADVNSAAAIAVSKLAHVGAGNVLRSNGTSNVGGQIVSGDITDGTIQTADLAANAATQVVPGSATGATSSGYPTWVTLAAAAITTAGGLVRLDVSLLLSTTVTCDAYLGWNLDGGGDQQMGIARVTAGQFIVLTAFAYVGAPASGAHTVNLRWMTTAGATITANAGSNRILTEFRR